MNLINLILLNLLIPQNRFFFCMTANNEPETPTTKIIAYDSTDETNFPMKEGQVDKRDFYIPDSRNVPPEGSDRPTLIKNVFTWAPSRIAAYVEQELQARMEQAYPIGSVWTSTKSYSQDKGAGDPKGCLGFGEWAYIGMKVLDKDGTEEPLLKDGTETDLYLYFYIRVA